MNNNDSNVGPVESPELTAVKARYADFLNANPSSKLIGLEADGSERFVIARPWGDRSIAIAIPDDDADLAAALNSLYLPPRYTAIYHSDSRVMEVIWTAYKLDEDQRDLDGRKFTLNLPNASYECEFTDSSERLLELAKNVLPLEISKTGFRNLQSFHTYLVRPAEDAEDEDLDAYGKPLSFWIREVDWDDEAIIGLVRHINFFLRYYDTQSPTVEIHPANTSNIAPKNRYFEGFGFPEVVNSPALDPKLVIMHSSEFSQSWTTNFLNHYRVIEYVSFDFTHELARKEVRSIISNLTRFMMSIARLPM